MKPAATRTKVFAALAALTAAILFTQTPAEARRYKHKVVRHHVVPAPVYGGHYGMRGHYTRVAKRAVAPRRYSQGARHLRSARTVTPRAWRTARVSQAARASHAAVAPAAGFGSSALVAKARAYLGTNPTGMSALWCARFMNMVLEKSGLRGTGSNMARSFASYGRRVSGPQVGAIAVMSRGRGGGHVGIVSGVDRSGNPIIISGNYNRRVAESVYSRGRIYAYVMP